MVVSVGCKKIRPHDLARETYISPARLAHVLKSVIDDYAATVGITLKAAYDAENLSGAMSLVASTGGVTLFPLYVQNRLTLNVVARALEGKSPAIDLMLGYSKANSSPLLKQFLSRADELVESVRKQSILRYVEAR